MIACTTRTAAPAIQDLPRPPWQGVHHLALVTPDMDATVRFYHGLLGMRLVATLKAGPMRHYFFEIGPGNTLAFFEWEGGRTFSKPAGCRVEQPLQLDHVSFNLPDRESLLALWARLDEAGVGVTDEIDHGFVHSIYFTDPNGIALEASYWLDDVTTRPEAERSAFCDPDPVLAVRELESGARLDWMPATDLVPEPRGIS
jgi:catechol 2,3-dioxygenase-like lactoylglutathione lyase family enzyme